MNIPTFFTTPTRKRQLVFIASLGVISFLLYSGGLDNFFVTDDFETLMYQRRYSSSWIDFFNLRYPYGRYLPFIQVLQAVVYLAFGPNPTAFHFVSLLVHTLNTMLVFYLAHIMKRSFYVSALAALIFATYVAHAEAVLWVAAIPYLYAGLFLLISLITFTKYLLTNKPLYYLSSLIAFLLLLLAFEPGAFAIAALFASELAIGGLTKRLSPTNLVKYLPFALLAVLHASAISFVIPAVAHRAAIGPHAVPNLLTLLWFMFVPVSRTISNHAPAPIVVSLTTLKAASLLLIPALGTYALVKGSNFTRFAVILLVAGMLPLVWFYPGTGLLDIAPLHGPRHVYIASIGFSLVVAVAVHRLYTFLCERRSSLATIALAVVVVLYLLLSGAGIILWGATTWEQSSQESRSIVTELERIITTAGSEATFYFVGPSWKLVLPHYAIPGYLGHEVDVKLVSEEEARSSPPQGRKQIFLRYHLGIIWVEEVAAP